MRLLAGPEERPHGEEVAVGLVLQLAESGGGIPALQRAGEKPTGVHDEVEFGVRHDAAGGLREGDGDEQHGSDEPAGPVDDHAQARRRTSRRFQVATSRSPGMRISHAHPSG